MIIDNTTVIREGKQDGFITEAQAYHMIRKYSDAYRIKLDAVESFTSMIDTTAVVVAISDTSTATTIEYLTAVG